LTVAEFLERKARRSEATRVTYGKAEGAFARCFEVKSADILVERMKAHELDPYAVLDKFVSYLLANGSAPKTVLTYVTAIKGLDTYTTPKQQTPDTTPITRTPPTLGTSWTPTDW
jgi:hypothetical protein